MASEWKAATAYTVGHIVVPTTIGTNWYVCTHAGTSGGAEPTWPTTKGANYLDNTVVWECHGGDGGVGMCKLAYSTYEVTFPGEGLDIKYTYGNPNSIFSKRSGTKIGPRSMVSYIGEDIYQIIGILRGPGAPADIATLRSIFKNRFVSNTITMTLTGDYATELGASMNVMHSGSTALRVSKLRGARNYNMVDIQLMRVDNS
jgi:hypothetical protein